MEESIRLIAVFLGSFIPTSVAVGLVLFRMRGYITKLATLLDKPASKVEENTNALAGLTNALTVMSLFNADLRADLQIAKQDREGLTVRLESFAETVDELLRADKDKTDASQRRDKEFLVLTKQIGLMGSDLEKAQTELKDCKQRLVGLTG